MSTPSNPGWATGFVPSAAQWAAVFSGKADYPAPVGQGGTGITATPADGQLLIGTGSGFRLNRITAGTGISITVAPGSITIDSNSGAEVLAELADPTGSSLIGFQQAGTGAVPRTEQEKLRDFVNVLDYGATGDGVTDDSAAVLAALNYAVGAGKQLRFPAGTYKLTSWSTPTLTGTVSLWGDGRNLSVITGVNTVSFVKLNPGGTFSANQMGFDTWESACRLISNTGLAAFQLLECHDCYFNGIARSPITDYDTYNATGGITEIRFSDNLVTNAATATVSGFNWAGGFRLDCYYIKSAWVTNNEIRGVGSNAANGQRTGVFLGGASYSQIASIVISGNRIYNVANNATSPGGGTGQCSGITAFGQSVRIENNSVIGVAAYNVGNSDCYGIYVKASFSRITGNVLIDAGGYQGTIMCKGAPNVPTAEAQFNSLDVEKIIAHNIITRTTLPPNDVQTAGIIVYNTGHNIHDNNISGLHTGIVIIAPITTAPGVTFIGGGDGSRAVATTTVVGGVITAVNLVGGGAGYTSAPTVVFDGGGIGASATATISGGSVNSVTLVSGGTGYSSGVQVRRHNVHDNNIYNLRGTTGYQQCNGIVLNSPNFDLVHDNTLRNLGAGTETVTYGISVLYGATTSSCSRVTIRGNKIDQVQAATTSSARGINIVFDGTAGSSANNLLVVNNEVSNIGRGINLATSSTMTASGIVVEGNDVTNASVAAYSNSGSATDWSGTMFDNKLAGVQWFTPASLTPSPNVFCLNRVRTANASATTITNFSGGIEGQQLMVEVDGNTTIAHNSNIYLNGLANWNPGGYGGTLQLVYKNTRWWEVSRVSYPNPGFTDNFNRADGPPGNTLNGKPWVATSAATNWQISSNQLAAIGATISGALYVDAGISDCTFTAVFGGTFDRNWGMILRFGDGANYFRFSYVGGTSVAPLGQLSKVVAGVTSIVATEVTSAPWVAGDTFAVVLAGSSFTIKKNGTTIITATDSSLVTNTKFGFWGVSTSGAARITNTTCA